MRLTTVTIQKFRNFVEPQRIEIEDDVTALVGKNESGKTTILKALHRLNPANGDAHEFNAVIEYPRWLLIPDQRNGLLEDVCPVSAEFVVDASDIAALADLLPAPLTPDAVVTVARSYGNDFYVSAEADLATVVGAAAAAAALDDVDATALLEADSLDAAIARAKEMAKELKESAPSRARALGAFPSVAEKHRYLVTGDLEEAAFDALAARVPKFFYFSDYSILPGECDLTELAQRMAAGGVLTEKEHTILALLARAQVAPSDFLDDNYESREAQLQAAGGDISGEVFQYWKANNDLAVVLNDDNVAVSPAPQGNVVNHRILKIELRDDRHGGVKTNFSTRSSGFQWFFSFFAAFSAYQHSDDPVIVLLDEPGMSLHGEAQKDFVKFIFNELGASKQTIYTTHSQFMVDPTVYEKLRAVHDKATRENQKAGVEVSRVNLQADRDTVLPVESALGYSISQHLFIGSGHHLLVEGSSDFIYLMRMSAYMEANKKPILSPKLAMIPVGGIANMPAFVALMGSRLEVSVLVDGEKSASVLDRSRNAAKENGISQKRIMTIGEIDSALPKDGDVEDLFAVADYLDLYNWAFKTNLVEGDLAGSHGRILGRIESVRGSKFDHALPAHALTDNQEDFFKNLDPVTVSNFEKVFALLNKSIEA